MTDLPRLYTLKEVAESMKYSLDKVRRALNQHPSIRPVGRGRGTRLTLDDYNALIEAMRGPGPGYIEPADGSIIPHASYKNALRALRSRRTREIARKIREEQARNR